MDIIRQQVSQARRRLTFQTFLGIVTWSLFATLLAAVLGLAVPKIWPLQLDPQTWVWSWVGGALSAGLLVALVWTYVARQNALIAAIELDRRCGLKERVSSVLSLSGHEIDSEAGRALLADASRRVAEVDVREHFPLVTSWRNLLPLLPAAAVLGLLIVPDAGRDERSHAAESALAKKQVEKSAEELKKKLEQERKKAESQGLEEAEQLFKRLEDSLGKLGEKDKVDRKEALLKLNDLKDELEKRRQALGGLDKMKDQLNQMKDINQGPAEKLAKALKNGDMKQAMEELKNLQEKLRNGEMGEAEQKQMAQQLDKMKEKLEQVAQKHEDAKRDLQERIKQLEREGKRAEAGELQRKLDQLQALDQQMQKLQELADKLGQCQQCLQQGDGKQAAQQLDQIAKQLEQMQREMKELEALDDVLQQLADAKNAMNCQECNGQGCEQCQGGMKGRGRGEGEGEGEEPGDGLGRGQGRGARPEEKTDTSSYESQVRSKVQKGEVVRAGFADGPNVAGKSKEQLKNEIGASLRGGEPEPLTNQRLPRNQRDHAKQYFERIRTGD